jgi:hypothetical protein
VLAGRGDLGSNRQVLFVWNREDDAADDGSASIASRLGTDGTPVSC